MPRRKRDGNTYPMTLAQMASAAGVSYSFACMLFAEHGAFGHLDEDGNRTFSRDDFSFFQGLVESRAKSRPRPWSQVRSS